jgi:hypothetical protein
MINTLEKEWQSFFVQLNEAEKKSVLLMLKVFLKSRKQGAGGSSIDQYNKEIDEALSEVEDGNYISQDEMENLAGKW